MKLNRPNQDRSQNGQADVSPAPMFTPAPAQPQQVFRSEHAARSFETRQRAHYAEVMRAAEEQKSYAAWLAQTIAELQGENHRDEEMISQAENVIRERREAIKQRDEQIAQSVREKTEKELQAANNQDDGEATAQLLVMHGFKAPTPPKRDRLVAPIADPGPTGGVSAPLLCRCGDVMSLDREGTQYIHLTDGGWEVAGEACKRPQATQAMPVVDDAVGGS